MRLLGGARAARLIGSLEQMRDLDGSESKKAVDKLRSLGSSGVKKLIEEIETADRSGTRRLAELLSRVISDKTVAEAVKGHVAEIDGRLPPGIGVTVWRDWSEIFKQRS